MQTYYASIPDANDFNTKWEVRLAEKVVQIALSHTQSLGESLAWLAEHRPQAYLSRHPLSEEELVFWEGRVTFIREMLGEARLPVTDEAIEACPMPFLQLLHEALGDIHAAQTTAPPAPPAPPSQDKSPKDEAVHKAPAVPKVFNLIPQAAVENCFMKVCRSLLASSPKNCFIKGQYFLHT